MSHCPFFSQNHGDGSFFLTLPFFFFFFFLLFFFFFFNLAKGQGQGVGGNKTLAILFWFRVSIKVFFWSINSKRLGPLLHAK